MIRLQLSDAPAQVELTLVQRARKKPTIEYARCTGSCDIQITPGRYTLLVTGSDETRRGSSTLVVSTPGRYEIKPSSRSTLVPGALLAAFGPGVMGAGAGLIGAHTTDNNEGDPTLFWAGAGMFTAGAVATTAGFYLYSSGPRWHFEEGNVPASNAAPAYGVEQAAPDEMPYQDGQPVPQGYRVESEPRKGLMTAGLITFGAAYGLMATIGAAMSKENSEYLRMLIPIVGPGLVDVEEDERPGLVLYGSIPQLAGALMLVWGATSERQSLVRESSVSVTPVITPGGGGLLVGGAL